MNKQKKVGLIVLGILLVCVSALAIFSRFFDKRLYKMLLNFGCVSSADNLMVHFIDVGQGDAIAVNLPDGRVMLIDTGTTSSKNLIDYLNNNVISSSYSKKIDFLVLTHTDADHIGGALAVAKNFDLGLVCLPVLDKGKTTYHNFTDYIEQNKIEYVEGYDKIKLNFDGCKVSVFDPISMANANDSCPIVKIEFDNSKFLFTGDISEDVEDDFVAKYGSDLDCDILKVAHHGSASSSSSLFLEVVSPEFAVISCGINNTYNHPSNEALNRLDAIGASVYRTDVLGDIMFAVGDDYDVEILSGNYRVFGFRFRFVYIVLVVDGIIMICMLIVLIDKDKEKGKKLGGKRKNEK